MTPLWGDMAFIGVWRARYITSVFKRRMPNLNYAAVKGITARSHTAKQRSTSPLLQKLCANSNRNQQKYASTYFNFYVTWNPCCSRSRRSCYTVLTAQKPVIHPHFDLFWFPSQGEYKWPDFINPWSAELICRKTSKPKGFFNWKSL